LWRAGLDQAKAGHLQSLHQRDVLFCAELR